MIIFTEIKFSQQEEFHFQRDEIVIWRNGESFIFLVANKKIFIFYT